MLEMTQQHIIKTSFASTMVDRAVKGIFIITLNQQTESVVRSIGFVVHRNNTYESRTNCAPLFHMYTRGVYKLVLVYILVYVLECVCLAEVVIRLLWGFSPLINNIYAGAAAQRICPTKNNKKPIVYLFFGGFN